MESQVDTQLKLFVWENVLKDYSSGIMFALAKDVEGARRLIRNEWGYSHYPDPDLNKKIGLDEDIEKGLMKEPKVYTKPCSYVLWGGS